MYSIMRLATSSSSHFTTIALLLLLCTLIFVVTANDGGTAAPININLRSQALSHMLRSDIDIDSASASSQADAAKRDEAAEAEAGAGGTPKLNSQARRRFGSRFTNKKNSNTSSNTRTSSNGNNGIVQLDLAGEIKTHISSPSYRAPNGAKIGYHDERTTPLFQWGDVGVEVPQDDHYDLDNGDDDVEKNIKGMTMTMRMPSIHLGTKYDFKKVWYGATRLLADLSWRGGAPGAGAGDKSTSAKASASTRTTLRGEVNVQNPNDASMEIEIGWKLPALTPDTTTTTTITDPSKVALRYDTQPAAATVFASTSLHKRLRLATRAMIVLDSKEEQEEEDDDDNGQGESREKEGTIHRRHRWRRISSEEPMAIARNKNKIPQELLNWSEGSWIPDVKMTAGGKIVANSAIGLQDWNIPNMKTPMSMLGDKETDIHTATAAAIHTGPNRVGVRLVISKQLNWNLLGMLQGNGGGGGAAVDHHHHQQYGYNDGNDTIVRLEVGGLLGSKGGYGSISAQAALENLRDTWRCTLFQEQMFAYHLQ